MALTDNYDSLPPDPIALGPCGCADCTPGEHDGQRYCEACGEDIPEGAEAEGSGLEDDSEACRADYIMDERRDWRLFSGD